MKSDIIKIEFYETRPPHNRQIFIKQIENLFNNFDVLKKIPINKVDSSSWFSILWTPYKSTKNALMNTSFLAFYKYNFNAQHLNNFTRPNLNINSNFTEIPLIGILPIKFENKIFLSRINKSKIYCLILKKDSKII